MKDNFPYLAQETALQEVQEAQRVPRQLDPKRNNQGTAQLHCPRLKIRRESEKLQEIRRQLPTKEFPKDCQLISQQKHWRQERAGKKYPK